MVKNVAIATATSIIPGPAGMIAAGPGMLNSMSNQMKATYDVACIHGKEDKVVKDLLIDIPLQSMGVPAGLSKIQELNELKEGEAEIIKQKIKGLGTIYAKKKMKRALTSLVPGLSTIFAITQAKMETAKVFATANSFFDPNEISEDQVLDLEISESQKEEEKIKILVNLMTLDSQTTPEELFFIQPLINKSNLSKNKKVHYLSSLGSSATDYAINFDLLKKSGDSKEVAMDLAINFETNHDHFKK